MATARAGLAPRIVLLGGRTPGTLESEADLGRRHLVARGVADASIIIEDSSRHTLENLIHLRNVLPEAAPGGSCS